MLMIKFRFDLIKTGGGGGLALAYPIMVLGDAWILSALAKHGFFIFLKVFKRMYAFFKPPPTESPSSSSSSSSISGFRLP